MHKQNVWAKIHICHSQQFLPMHTDVADSFPSRHVGRGGRGCWLTTPANTTGRHQHRSLDDTLNESRRYMQRLQLIVRMAGMLAGIWQVASSVDIADNVSSSAVHNTVNTNNHSLADFSLSLFAELKFGLSPDVSQKVKWFCWVKDLDQIYCLSTDLDRS